MLELVPHVIDRDSVLETDRKSIPSRQNSRPPFVDSHSWNVAKVSRS